MKHKFKIITIVNGKEFEFNGSYPTEVKANKAFKKLVDKNEKEIVFPVRYIINETMQECVSEYLMLKIKEEKDDSVTKLRNEYGEFVDHIITNNDKWIIYDKARCDREESFWVYGYHPFIQRKDFLFIYNEMFKPKALDKTTFLRIVVFKNKLLLETTNTLDMVICKNNSDCIRLYNMLNEWSNRDKLKYVLFNGDGDSNYKDKMFWSNKIQELTNWNRKKILRASTRP